MKRKFNYRKIATYLLLLAAGLLAGWILFGGEGKNGEGAGTVEEQHLHEEASAVVWTCSMHPQVRQDEPGLCPICGMDLIPLSEEGGDDEIVSPDDIRLTEAAAALARVRTAKVSSGAATRNVFMLGRVEADERNIATITARFPGRIEKLYVNFTGQEVRQGERMAEIYSPELYSAQKELLEAAKFRDNNPELYNAARKKLRFWDLTDAQIDRIEQSGTPEATVDILAPIPGTVTMVHVAQGDYINEGSTIFRVVDLNNVWVMFEAYESDLPWIEKGDEIRFSVRSHPGREYSGKISFIDPLVEPSTRIAEVRVETANRNGSLKPGMFAEGFVEATIETGSDMLMIPKTAVLWTGKRSVVYVQKPGTDSPVFEYRQVTLGPDAGDYYVVAEGLEEGEEIAVNGVFKIDAAAQLAGKVSMMNPEGGAAPAGHQHGTMEGNGRTEEQKTAAPGEEFTVPDQFREQIMEVIGAYMPMKDAFVASDADLVSREARKVETELKDVDMDLLSGSAHMTWMEYQEEMQGALQEIIQADNLEVKREAFSAFNLALYKVARDFGLSGDTLYYQYCPMAIQDRGAYWFSEIKEIRNPYFGDMMLKCGETREIFD